jgi:hypothetical protein
MSTALQRVNITPSDSVPMHHWRCLTNRHIWRNSTIHQQPLSHLKHIHPPHTSSVHTHSASRLLPLASTEYSRSSSAMASVSTSNGTATNGAAAPEIILYTNHACPWAHRAHIALKELGLPYTEEIIDLERPRDPWYLKVNPVCHSYSFGDFPKCTSAGCSRARIIPQTILPQDPKDIICTCEVLLVVVVESQ